LRGFLLLAEPFQIVLEFSVSILFIFFKISVALNVTLAASDVCFQLLRLNQHLAHLALPCLASTVDEMALILVMRLGNNKFAKATLQGLQGAVLFMLNH